MSNFREIFDRLKLFYGVKTDKEVANSLNINYNTIKTWSNRENIPVKTLFKSIQNESINTNWLLTGKGSMRNEESTSVVATHNSITVGHNNSNVSINTASFDHGHEIKEIVELLQYAPSAFLGQVKERLLEFKKLSQL